MFSYEKQNREFREGFKLFIILSDEISIGSIFIDERMEPEVKQFIKELNAWGNKDRFREREGIQFVTGESSGNLRVPDNK